MLPAANRLRDAADFAQTTRRGTKVTRGSVVVYVDTSDDPCEPRVGLVVSKAVGNSVVRHRAARRIRASIRPVLAALPTGTRVVVRALPGSATDAGLTEHICGAVTTGLARAERS